MTSGNSAAVLAPPNEGGARRGEEDRALARSPDAAVFRTDAGGRCVHVDEQWRRMTGRTLTEALGDGWLLAVHPEDRERVWRAWRAAVADRRQLGMEFRYLRPDGKTIWVLAQSVLTREAGEGVYVGTVTDITDRVRAEHERARVAAVIESSADAIVLLDVDGTVTSWNEGAERMFGYSAAEMIGAPIGKLAPLGAEQQAGEVFRRALAGESLRALEAARRRKDGTLVHVSLTACPIRDARGRITAVSEISQDISDRKRAEHERQALLDDLRSTVHFYDLFIGILSHDLRTPLGAILMSAHLVMRRGGEDVRRPLARILASGRRMERMIGQLLDVTRIRAAGGLAVNAEPADLGDICAHVAAEIESAHPGSKLVVTSSGRLGGRWDADRLAQVFSNLLGNAIQHARGSRSVQIVLDGVEPARVRASIHNEGAIPADLLPVVFDPFRSHPRASAEERGLGLGLYITKQIAQAHGGDIDVTSSEEAGTTFVLDLPREARPPAPARIWAAPGAKLP